MTDRSQSRSLRGSLLLLLGAVIWGAAFVAQRVGVDHLGPFSFNGIRMLMAGLVLIPLILWMDRKRKAPAEGNGKERRELLKGGLICGLLLFAATSLQQAGLVYTTAGKAGFLTALYVVLVPVAGWLLFRQNPSRMIRISVLLAVAALYLLCMKESESGIQPGDLMMIGCALCFTFQILAVDRYAPRVDPLKLCCIEFLVTGTLSVIIALTAETISAEGIRTAWIPLLYAGVMSGAVGYTLQAVGQRDTDPTVASLIMCLEAVFATLTGAVLLGERMTGRETWGCVLMFIAVVLAQLSPVLTARLRQSGQSPR